jgi:L-cysteine/cystine lyase
MQEDEKVKLARGALPVSREHAYLDTGSIGPVSTVFAEALARSTDEDLRAGRALMRRYDRMAEAREKIRSEIASLLGVAAQEIVLTRSTTDGIRTLLARHPWSPGDEIVTTQLEFPPCIDAIGELARGGEVSVRTAEVPATNVDGLAWLERCMTPKTRLIAVSGVAFTQGMRLPIERIAEFASANGVHTLVDGAQLVGAATPDLAGTAIDFLAMPLQKWICGPEGLGALYVRGDTLPPGTRDQLVHGWPVLEAAAEHLEWMRESLGWPWIHERTTTLAAHARDVLQGNDSIRVVTPNAHAGLVSVQCARGTTSKIVDRLHAKRMIVRHRPELDLLRISTAFFNTEEEIDRFASII